MPEPDIYLLGRGVPEEERLKRQIADLAPDSDTQLEKIGIRPGERVVDIGCGPGGVLHLLAKRVGPTGSVLGIDRSAHFVEQARRFAADLGLTQVEVQEGDAYDTGLLRASFDGAHMRLVLVNVPKPELIVREIVSLVRRAVLPTTAFGVTYAFNRRPLSRAPRPIHGAGLEGPQRVDCTYSGHRRGVTALVHFKRAIGG